MRSSETIVIMSLSATIGFGLEAIDSALDTLASFRSCAARRVRDGSGAVPAAGDTAGSTARESAVGEAGRDLPPVASPAAPLAERPAEAASFHFSVISLVYVSANDITSDCTSAIVTFPGPNRWAPPDASGERSRKPIDSHPADPATSAPTISSPATTRPHICRMCHHLISNITGRHAKSSEEPIRACLAITSDNSNPLGCD
jgi:hypothetical protein